MDQKTHVKRSSEPVSSPDKQARPPARMQRSWRWDPQMDQDAVHVTPDVLTFPKSTQQAPIMPGVCSEDPIQQGVHYWTLSITGGGAYGFIGVATPRVKEQIMVSDFTDNWSLLDPYAMRVQLYLHKNRFAQYGCVLDTLRGHFWIFSRPQDEDTDELVDRVDPVTEADGERWVLREMIEVPGSTCFDHSRMERWITPGVFPFVVLDRREYCEVKLESGLTGLPGLSLSSFISPSALSAPSTCPVYTRTIRTSEKSTNSGSSLEVQPRTAASQRDTRRISPRALAKQAELLAMAEASK